MPSGIHWGTRFQSLGTIVLLNILLALVIFYNAELGRILGLQEQPLAISVVWPSTGFALAALLLFGTKVWPGIFLGNFGYNFLHLYLGQKAIFYPMIAAAIIAFGSLLQALVGNYIMRRYCTSGYFNTVKDVMIFLIPAGLLTCLIASTIGTLTLYFYSPMSWSSMLYTGLTFWIGDTMGVYIFTPLIIVWATRRAMVDLGKHKWEAFFMFLALIWISVLTFGVDYSLVHLYVPLSVWVAYRFRMHGATLSIFFITIILIVATSAGFGPFDRVLTYNPLLILVTFLEMIVATCLILAAVANEREAAWNQIQNHNIDLQEAIDMRREELQEMSHEVVVKEKLASLGLLTSGTIKQMQIFLKEINDLTKTSLVSLGKFQDLFNTIKDKTESEITSQFESNYEKMENSLTNVVNLEMQLNKVAKVIEEQSVLTTYGRIKVKSINVNMLLSRCLIQARRETERRYPDFTFIADEDYDKTIEMILIVPIDLAHAFYHLMNRAIYSMKEKKDRFGDTYVPSLSVRTENDKDRIEIIIRDNGMGLTKQQVKEIFFSFMESKDSEELAMSGEVPDFTVALAGDIIKHLYRGEIFVDTKEGEYLEFKIFLPKDRSQKIQDAE